MQYKWEWQSVGERWGSKTHALCMLLDLGYVCLEGLRGSVFLEENHPGQRGFSVQSVERFCSDKGIHKTSRIDDISVILDIGTNFRLSIKF